MYTFNGRSLSDNAPRSFLSNSVSYPRQANLQSGSFWDIIPRPCNILTSDNQSIYIPIPSTPYQENTSLNYQSLSTGLLSNNNAYFQKKPRISGELESGDEDDDDDDDDDDSDGEDFFGIKGNNSQYSVSPKTKRRVSKGRVSFIPSDKIVNLEQNKQNIERSCSKYEDINLNQNEDENLYRDSLHNTVENIARLKVNRSLRSNSFEEKENKSVSIKKRKTQTDEIAIPNLKNLNEHIKNKKPLESNIPVKRGRKGDCAKKHEEEDDTKKQNNRYQIKTVDFFGEHCEFQQSSSFEEMIFHEPQAGILSTCAIRAKNTSCGYIHISSKQCITSETTSSITIMVLAGSLTVTNNGKSCIVNEGAFIYIPSGMLCIEDWLRKEVSSSGWTDSIIHKHIGDTIHRK